MTKLSWQKLNRTEHKELLSYCLKVDSLSAPKKLGPYLNVPKDNYVVLDLSEFCDLEGETSMEVEKLLNDLIINEFLMNIKGDKFFYSFSDHNHDSYRVNLNLFDIGSYNSLVLENGCCLDEDDLHYAVRLLPDGDYSHFLSPTKKIGLFGDYENDKLYLFGFKPSESFKKEIECLRESVNR